MDSDTFRRIAESAPNVRVLRSADSPLLAEDLVGLFNSIYARRTSSEYVHWRYSGTVADDGAAPGSAANGSSLLLYQGSRLLGACGYNVLAMSGKPGAKVGMVLDLMVAPSLRENENVGARRQVGLAAARLMHEVTRAVDAHSVDATIGFGNPQGARWWMHHPNATTAEDVITFAASSSPAARQGSLDFDRVSRFENWVNDVSASFERMHPDLAMIRRDDNYLNWRFVSNPSHSYELFRASRSGVPLGYVVLKVFRDPHSGEAFGDIVDVLWAEQDRALLEEILRFALNRFCQMGIGSVAAWLQPNTLLHEIGCGVGFVPTSQPRKFCIMLDKGNDASLADARRWYLTMSDSEIY